MHGIVGGGIQCAEGGSFKDGFIGAATGDIVDGVYGTDVPSSGDKAIFYAERTAAAAVVGGTAAALTGGNFWNGAKMGAMAELYNTLGHVTSDVAHQDTTTGKYNETLLATESLQMDGYSTTTLKQGNSNVEQVVDLKSGDPLGVVTKYGYGLFNTSRSIGGSTTYGMGIISTFSVGSTSDGRYIVDMSVMTGCRSSIGATLYYDPSVFQSRMRSFGNLLAKMSPAEIFPLYRMLQFGAP